MAGMQVTKIQSKQHPPHPQAQKNYDEKIKGKKQT